MSSATPTGPEPESTQNAIPKPGSDWIRLFTDQYELDLINAGFGLPKKPGLPKKLDYPFSPEKSIDEIMSKYVDSLKLQEIIREAMGEALIESESPHTEWNSDLNQRRFELIDKEIQETISPEESIELAGLTKIMRKYIDSEENLPMKGAKDLHRRLLELDNQDKSH